MARKTNPVSPARIGSEKEKAKGRAKAAVVTPPIPYKKVGAAAESEQKRAADRASKERIESDNAANGAKGNGFSLRMLKEIAAGGRSTGGGTVLPHTGVIGGLRMSDQMEPAATTENAVTERVINRKPYNFRPTPAKNSPVGATPEQEEAQRKYIADAMATPEGQAYQAKWDAIREKNAAEAAEREKASGGGIERREF